MVMQTHFLQTTLHNAGIRLIESLYDTQPLSQCGIFLSIIWSKYWEHKDNKVGQDIGKCPEMFTDAKIALGNRSNTQHLLQPGTDTWANSALFRQPLDEAE